MNIDVSIINSIESIRNPLLNSIFIFITHLGDLMIIWIFLALFLFIKYHKTKQIKYFAFISLLGFLLNDLLLKELFKRPRPFMQDNLITCLIKEPLSYSMPSGHSLTSFLAASILSYYFKQYTIYFYLLASLIAFSRVYVGVHYPSDILIGACLGLIIGKLILKKVNQND